MYFQMNRELGHLDKAAKSLFRGGSVILLRVLPTVLNLRPCQLWSPNHDHWIVSCHEINLSHFSIRWQSHPKKMCSCLTTNPLDSFLSENSLCRRLRRGLDTQAMLQSLRQPGIPGIPGILCRPTLTLHSARSHLFKNKVVTQKCESFLIFFYFGLLFQINIRNNQTVLSMHPAPVLAKHFR